ncbi:HD domain-containing protein [Variovorax sp. J22P271]|uniref:HD domain-containing protein n=1 Tax=Variovorax davisae TaxID=3053515 RepID=UPI002576F44B|nr:HD domain-containing protein [Variovorax sp. J22P271]MDM0032492.1 HD domain-containing protein [Variovorax sp. J22P271]
MRIGETLRCISISISLTLAACIAAPNAHAQAVAPQRDRAVLNERDPLSDTRIPDTALARDAAQAIRQAEGELLYEHSMRVYYWAALVAKRKGLAIDPELLYVAAMFHDYGLTAGYGESHLRFEVDGANAAREFLRSHGRPEAEAQRVWLSIALHTTNGISRHLDPIAQILAEGANMDLVGAGFGDFTSAQRRAVEAAHPRPPSFADDFLRDVYESLKHRPETTQGTGLADVIASRDPAFRRRDFSSLVRQSPWASGK